MDRGGITNNKNGAKIFSILPLDHRSAILLFFFGPTYYSDEKVEKVRTPGPTS
jgi:hypothetical protein